MPRTVDGINLKAGRWLQKVLAHFGRQSRPGHGAEEAPLRSELFSADQMALHGKALAGAHRLGAKRSRDLLLARLVDNERVLLRTCRLLTAAIRDKRPGTPAGEWLLDNFHLVEEQIRTARRHLPKDYSRELPRLERGPSAGLPRVYDIALEAIAHGDGLVDPESFSRFIAAYQTHASLTLGELWAIPIMLRLALIENLRRAASRIISHRIGRDLADFWAGRMSIAAQDDPKSLILVVADMARSEPPMNGAFVAELARRLQGQSAALAMPVNWIEQRLAELGLTIAQLVQAENQQQAADQVSISNSIGSLRLLGATDWHTFVETMSAVDRILRRDPGDVYGRMSFATRDQYRHAVEALSRRSGLAEDAVAARCLALAQEAQDRDEEDELRSHVGFYLVDKGLPLLEAAAGVRAPLLRACLGGRAVPAYVGAIGAATLLFSAALVVLAHAAGAQGWRLVLIDLLALLAASQLAVALVNWIAMQLVAPRPLPRLDFSKGIAPGAGTLVVVPTLITSTQNVEALVEKLEVRFLANRDPGLQFALLTDFADAREAALPGDDALLRLAAQRIEELNLRHGAAFHLLHRPRLWNAGEGAWIGRERKRGKLEDLNALLRGGNPDAFSRLAGTTASLVGVRYVITLDTDTELPRDAARELVGAMAHPLNRPRHDAADGRVTDGYGILQPRMATSLGESGRSRHARMHGDDPGIDPYTRMVSDVYQDLFGEGSFIGKGIYDVDAFERALRGRLRDNCILSHDLIEGCHARSGLLGDVCLYESEPASSLADASRRHRWMRGDWQLAGWLLRWRGSLPLLSQWKILDNLRRSLVAPAFAGLLLAGWFLLPAPSAWTLALLAMLVLPALCVTLVEVLRRPGEMRLQPHLAGLARATGRRLSQAVFALASLPFDAWTSLDAVMRTIVRMVATRRHLLEWTPSDAIVDGTSLGAFLRAMWIAPFLAAGVAAAVLAWRPGSVAAAAPVLLLWFASPLLAWWLSRPVARPAANLSAAQTACLRLVARKTWSYFETYVGAADHWLPPDNVQEAPVARVAHRTSPTNMGLALLANLTAYDLGYAPAGVLLARTRQAFDTMQGLERHHGHFCNWYDTQTLQPLPPVYLSTVDSGNLAGHLLTLRAGLAVLADEPALSPRWLEGLRDTHQVLADAVGEAQAVGLRAFGEAVESALARPPQGPAATRGLLQRLASEAAGIAEGRDPASDAEVDAWARALERQCRDLADDLAWLDAGTQATLPTLRELAALPADSQTPSVARAAARARARMDEIERLGAQAAALAQHEVDFLYDEVRHLLAIGYNVTERRRDAGSYDLLASEARLAVFVAIAQGRLPQQSWFALGRLLVNAGSGPTLLSWSGSMFEYLMPVLVMPAYDGSLLEASYRAAVRRQIDYGAGTGVPWGMSESGYNATDTALNYQYRAFGVPGLGLKRGLSEDLVIAPYASALALLVEPAAACANLQRLAGEGVLGRHGFHEAVDYTASRLRRTETFSVVRSFMAHHQGMTLLALAHLLLDRPMQRRFASDPLFQATLLLLQERVPRAGLPEASNPQHVDAREPEGPLELPMRVFGTPDTRVPGVQLLSNGRYHVMVTNAGGGYSRWKDLAVTRWREDSTRDPWGTFCYLRDPDSGRIWSPTHQPVLAPAESYEAVFTEQRVEFRRRDADFDTHTEVVVSPEDDIELRRVRITNRSRARRTLEVTSYAEVVLGSGAADALHPAFSNLFVQTEIVPSPQAILCARRPRSREESTPWMVHLMAVHGAVADEASCETDRARFLGRGGSPADPKAVREGGALSGSQGSVLDPIVAIRRRVTLEPEQTATIDLVTGIGENRGACLHLAEKYQDRRLADRAFEMAWTHSQVALRQINVTEAEAQLYGRLAGAIIHADSALRAEPAVIARNRRGQSGLWGYAISGDLPIVLLQIQDPANVELARQLVQAHAYWRLKGLAVDLVIWNEERSGYRQLLHDEILGLIAASQESAALDRPGGIFVRSAEQIPTEDRVLLQAVARVVLTDGKGTLAEQVKRRPTREPAIAPLAVDRARATEPAAVPAAPPPERILGNGLGGFSADGREYITTIAPQRPTPAPWTNVLANPQFGCVLSESGSAYTWNGNAHEFRLTPWNNDAVGDDSGEAFYLRDEESGRLWSPTALPCPGSGEYVARHGFGYSVFEHDEGGIATELTVHVDLELPVKYAVLKVTNGSGRARRLSATGYVEWVLGDLRSRSGLHVVTMIDPGSGGLLAHNAYNPEFAGQYAFFDVDEVERTLSGDRAEFIGRNGSLRNPAALGRARLSGRVGAALDPCAAIQVPFDLAEGATREIIFRLGASRGADNTSRLVQRLRRSGTARASLAAVRAFWARSLGAVQVETPDRSLDVLCNGWLMYQTLACRLWGRSGHYQSGGAFGFRDQLQDTMALVHAAPHLARDHLLLCASRQFAEGDVQHWWHPFSGRGVRTHCTDDYLWLPLAVCRYVQATGDAAVLKEQAGFLESRAPGPGEDSYYDLPTRSPETASLYQHCVRAVLMGLRLGERGLPLMGSGDWNDGMNLVGAGGKGESVWLGFFLHHVLVQFAALARLEEDEIFAARCITESARLRENLDRHGWDGDWYRRAYFDDGTPLGSAANTECQIDSIAQSWSVLSGAGGKDRTRLAMAALDRRLVRREHALVQLLDPPFDSAEVNPGYIRGYAPGVRENGGQYTHAAIWASMAFAALGDPARAWELLDMINPLRHSQSPESAAVYKVEPYVVAADVYAVAPHIGRGGWTWYTGSAAWLYRLVLESLLGLSRSGATLQFAPCVTASWPQYRIRYRYLETWYDISFRQAGGEGSGVSVSLDGQVQAGPGIALEDDRRDHLVEVRFSPPSSAAGG